MKKVIPSLIFLFCVSLELQLSFSTTLFDFSSNDFHFRGLKTENLKAEIVWNDIEKDLKYIEGKGWEKTSEYYVRLPDDAKNKVPPAVVKK